MGGDGRAERWIMPELGATKRGREGVGAHPSAGGCLSPRTCPRQSRSLSFQQYGGFYRSRKALLKVQFSDRARWALLGSCQGPRHTTFVHGPLRRACVSHRCPSQQLRGREAACDAKLLGAPSCKRAQGPRGAPASQQGRGKGEWRVEVRPWLGCSSLLSGGRCTRSMREPEKGSLGTSWGGRAFCTRKSLHLSCHFLAWIYWALIQERIKTPFWK